MAILDPSTRPTGTLAAADIQSGVLQALVAHPAIASLKFFVATRLESVDPAIAEIASIVARVTRLPEAQKAVQPVRGAFGRKGRGPA